MQSIAGKISVPGVVILDITIDTNDLEGGARTVINVIRPQWKTNSIIYTVYTAGITNRLIGCHQQDDIHMKDAVLVRMYGENTELVVDRNMEMAVMYMLSKVGCCKSLYAQLNNGIVYGFMPGECVTVDTVRDPHIGRLIAEEVAKYHVLKPRTVASDLGEDGLKGFTMEEPRKLLKAFKYFDLSTEVYNDPDKTERYRRDFPPLSVLKNELDELTPYIGNLKSPIVFCHNDLLVNNIIYNKLEDRCYFIDFEYSCINFQASEISTFFCEWAGVSDKGIDYSVYPDRPTQSIWLTHYLRAYRSLMNYADTEPSQKDVDTLYIQVNQMSLLSHLGMAGWSLVQARHSHLDFDYLGFAKARLDQYFATKEEFLALKMPD